MAELQRFIDAQAPVWDDVLAELRAGRKRTHWMWFVFPQIDGLGSSSTARRFAVADLAEARAYLAHPVLGARLREACDVLLGLTGMTATAVLGYPDDLKLRSSMTLFAAADPEEPRFPAVLAQWYEGPDPRTLELLAG
ncbi:Uncharacterized protein, DUF1810 family [Klenkia marina]|uniref:Uncharacterized protein, DUF1810 family n=1 Tax=Klenkia marina TaxID=1960309 RepID=A0A1G4XEI9_9ACTN|nr:DUF1810 domain-containing protein [Klenkia marina]SCX39640.1 Uncharacterized protein, DUF1810 family [Klenkia marina]